MNCYGLWTEQARSLSTRTTTKFWRLTMMHLMTLSS
uniref:Uncharacterized protein n=1 Tax=Arundo donax TaxID=35708 RepID=A0A0A9EAE1_ARUDO